MNRWLLSIWETLPARRGWFTKRKSTESSERIFFFQPRRYWIANDGCRPAWCGNAAAAPRHHRFRHAHALFAKARASMAAGRLAAFRWAQLDLLGLLSNRAVAL